MYIYSVYIYHFVSAHLMAMTPPRTDRQAHLAQVAPGSPGSPEISQKMSKAATCSISSMQWPSIGSMSKYFKCQSMYSESPAMQVALVLLHRQSFKYPRWKVFWLNQHPHHSAPAQVPLAVLGCVQKWLDGFWFEDCCVTNSCHSILRLANSTFMLGREGNAFNCRPQDMSRHT